MDKECLRQCLSDAGCQVEVTGSIMERLQSGNMDDMLRLIKKERCRAMDEYHESGRKVDCMDFAIRNLEREIKENGGIRK